MPSAQLVVEDWISMVRESQGTRISECPANLVNLVDFLLGSGKDGLPELRVRQRMQSRVESKDGEVGWGVK